MTSPGIATAAIAGNGKPKIETIRVMDRIMADRGCGLFFDYLNIDLRIGRRELIAHGKVEAFRKRSHGHEGEGRPFVSAGEPTGHNKTDRITIANLKPHPS